MTDLDVVHLGPAEGESMFLVGDTYTAVPPPLDPADIVAMANVADKYGFSFEA